MADNLSVLIVDDDAQLIRILQAVLKEVKADIRVAGTGRLALQELQDNPPAILLLDMKLPDMEGLEILKEVRGRGTPITVIVMTAHGSVDLAVDAMRQGAYDFLTKPLDFERVKVMVRNAVERHRIIEELDNFRNQYERTRFRGLVGSSPAMQRLYRQLRSVGAGASPVLIVGEKGTETAGCARALHDESVRAAKPFEVRAAEGLSTDSLASAIRAAEGGTLFVENIQFLSPETAAVLLAFTTTRLLDGKEYDTRILASEDGTLAASVSAGRVPAELKLALEVARVQVPRLRERSDDVLDVAENVLLATSKELSRSFTGFTDEVQVAFVNYAWPGNREELESAIRLVAQRHEGRLVTREMLPKAIADAVPEGGGGKAGSPRGLETAGAVRPLWMVEREEVEKALKLCDGNVLQAARLLEVSPATIYRKQQTWKSMGA